MRETRITLSWPCYQWQVEATRAFYGGLAADLRYFVWVVSRQNGKTALLQSICIRECFRRGGTYYYLAPAYDRSEEVYNECCDALRELIEAGMCTNKKTTAGWVIRFRRQVVATGLPAALHFKSLGNPEHLRGATLDGAVIDETGLVQGRVFRKIVEPMLVAKDGWVVFSGTPPEDEETPDPDFFRGTADYAREEGDDRWYYIHRDYLAHPSGRVVRDIEQKRKRMPEEEFAREYLATFPREEKYRLPRLRWWGPTAHEKDLNCPRECLRTRDTRVETGIDLADNDQEIGDKASVVTWFIQPGGRVFFMAAQYFQNPSEVLDALYSHKALFNPDVVWVQKTAFDKGFRHTVDAAGPSRGFLPVEMTSFGGSGIRKAIMQMEPLARAGKIFVHESLREFAAEWNKFPDNLRDRKERIRNRMRHHYDILSAASLCVPSAQDLSSWTPEPPARADSVKRLLRAMTLKRRGASRHEIEKTFRLGGANE